MKSILALDLGTATGFFYNRPGALHRGTWLLATDAEIATWGKNRLRRRKDPRIERLCERLTALGTFDVVIFEDVQFGSTTYQTQLWSSLRSCVWLCAEGPLTECVPVATLKLFATGNGHATKQMMLESLKRRHPAYWSPELDDNAVDAAWLWIWAARNIAGEKL